jgi:hypothetical protein
VAAALQQAQQLAAELKAQQETLRNTNAELEEQAAQSRVRFETGSIVVQ